MSKNNYDEELYAMGTTPGEAAVWAFSEDEGAYFACPKTAATIKPGAYQIIKDYDRGVYFKPETLKNEELIRFPSYVAESIIEEIKNFWSRKNIFRKYRI